jgi:hypothetical protein
MKYIIFFVKWLSSLNNIKLARTVLIAISVLCVIGYIRIDIQYQELDIHCENERIELQRKYDSATTIHSQLYEDLYYSTRAELDSINFILNAYKSQRK